MAVPVKNTGTRSPRTVADGGGGGVRGGRPNADSKGGRDAKGGKKKKKGKKGFSLNVTPLNPEFDARMRRVGSPLNASDKIKRGWIQTEEDNLRVNFLFNPSQLDLQHQTLDSIRTSQDIPEDDVLGVSYASMGSTTSVKLLYDRTYEMFSPDASGKGKGFANRFGVWADVAAWYVLLGMLPDMPTSWDTSLVTDPPQPKLAFLFVGPKMVYYGRLSGINVTYSHWSQNMIPMRCAVDVGFEILPFTSGVITRNGRVQSSHPTRGTGITSADSSGTWGSDFGLAGTSIL